MLQGCPGPIAKLRIRQSGNFEEGCVVNLFRHVIDVLGGQLKTITHVVFNGGIVAYRQEDDCLSRGARLDSRGRLSLCIHVGMNFPPYEKTMFVAHPTHVLSRSFESNMRSNLVQCN